MKASICSVGGRYGAYEEEPYALRSQVSLSRSQSGFVREEGCGEPCEVSHFAPEGWTPSVVVGSECHGPSSSSENDCEEIGFAGCTNCQGSSSSIAEVWEMNYREAGIFLAEGENNWKFSSHPRNRNSLPVYLLVHNHWFYCTDMVVSIILLSLAAVEAPAFDNFHVPTWLHSSIELIALSVLAMAALGQMKWQGCHTYVRHTRSALKSVLLVVMFFEAFVVLLRRSSHIRITRSLRPLFLIDNHYLGGVRRFVRQILQSLPPILDMLLLLLFFILVYALMGFYLFGAAWDNPSMNGTVTQGPSNDDYFSTFEKSFVALFVLLTTANFPDVMLPSYADSAWSPLFFISYLIIVLYFLMNLFLAVVYDAFTELEKDKFRRLFLHKRAACENAFRLLVSRGCPNGIRFCHFEGMMQCFRPEKSRQEVYLIFKSLRPTSDGYIPLHAFFNIYESLRLHWKPALPPPPWFESSFVKATPGVSEICRLIRDLVNTKFFANLVYCIIFGNGLALFVRAALFVPGHGDKYALTWDLMVFVLLYVLEAILKLIGLGPTQYFTSGWNTYDFLVTLLSAGGLLGHLFRAPFAFIIVLRPLRLLHLFKLKRRYRGLFDTLIIILPRMFSAAVVLGVVYYFFAIIGMEVFSKYDLRNCCKNSTVEVYYRWDNSTQGLYYLNTFSNIFASGLTLFEVAVVNNWSVIMDAYAIVTNSEWSRLYFFIFYLVTLVVLTLVVTVILDAFLFRIVYQRKYGDCMFKEEMTVVLSPEELRRLGSADRNLPPAPDEQLKMEASDTRFEAVVYLGHHPPSKDLLQLAMYADEIRLWTGNVNDEVTYNLATPKTRFRVEASGYGGVGTSSPLCLVDASRQRANSEGGLTGQRMSVPHLMRGANSYTALQEQI